MSLMEAGIKKRHIALTYIGISVFTLIMLVPFFFIVLLSFKDNTEILMNPLEIPDRLDFSNYVRAIQTLDPLQLYKNTFVVVIIAIAIQIPITFLGSVALTRLVFKNKKLQEQLYLFMLLGLTIPVYALLFPVYRITISMGLYESLLALVPPYVAMSISFNTLVLTGFLRDFPKEIEEAAIIDGCDLCQLCFKIIAPIVSPALITVFIFNVLYIWNEFPLAITLISKPENATISLGISLFQSQYTIDYGAIVAACLMLITPQIIFYAFFQKHIIGGLTAGAVKG